MAQDHPTLNIGEANRRYQHFKQKSCMQSQEISRLLGRNKELLASRENWKAKAMSRQQKLVQLKAEFSLSKHPLRHRYSLQMIEISVKLYLLCRCSLRGTTRVLRLFFGESVPCKSTISNWLHKAGYHVYSQPVAAAKDGFYSLILDESMVIGQQRMLYGLVIESVKRVAGALQLCDVKASFLAVAPSWKAGPIGSFLASIEGKLGSKLRYLICDTDTTLCKAVADQGMLRIRDVGHEMARFLRQIFERKDDFKDFTYELAQVKFREIMKPSAYLLPPQARSQARFMNLSHSIEWARRMLLAWPKLSKEEQDIFAFLPRYRPLIEELSRIFDWLNPLLQHIKDKGLSHITCQDLQLQLKDHQKIAQSDREIKLIQRVETYLEEEKTKIADPTLCYHASSDIIESAFGLFKDRHSPNKLHGVTPSVLLLALRTRADPEKLTLNLDLKQAMEEISLEQIQHWRVEHLSPNLVQQRINTLKKSP